MSTSEQITTLEARIAVLEKLLDVDATDATMPADCQARECDYYNGYLAYGPAELTHVGYHSAEKLYEKHADSCTWNWHRSACPACKNWETRLRA